MAVPLVARLNRLSAVKPHGASGDIAGVTARSFVGLTDQ
jgi:hypothetical protein